MKFVLRKQRSTKYTDLSDSKSKTIQQVLLLLKCILSIIHHWTRSNLDRDLNLWKITILSNFRIFDIFAAMYMKFVTNERSKMLCPLRLPVDRNQSLQISCIMKMHPSHKMIFIRIKYLSRITRFTQIWLMNVETYLLSFLNIFIKFQYFEYRVSFPVNITLFSAWKLKSINVILLYFSEI